ncbi:MAG TPA: cytochrome P450 [Micromonosporaceae bacterium]|nr:cytochrome P450 [Micromonosporaceae bacterium]
MTGVEQLPEPVPYPFGEPVGLDLHPTYHELLASGALLRVRMPFGEPAWLVTRQADIKVVLGDPRFSRARAIGAQEPRVMPVRQRPGTILALDPPEHTRLRRAVARAFTARRTETLRQRATEVVGELLDELQKQGPPADLVPSFALPLPVIIICELLGVPYADWDRFRQWSDLVMSAGAVPRDRAVAALEELGEYLAGLAGQRRVAPADDLISALMHAADVEDRLTVAEAVGLSSGVLVAGYETTANEIANFCYLLLTSPDHHRQLRQRPELIGPAVEEMLRFVPHRAHAAFARVATEDVELGGVLIRAGEAVLPALIAADRDPTAFTEPDTLDFHRTDNSHLAFGYGPHHCLGAQLARMELQVAIGGLLARFPDLALAVPAEDVPWRTGMVARGPRQLPVTW